MSTATVTAPKLPSAFRLGLHRIGIELRQFFRDKESAVFTFLLPMILLVVFGSVFNSEIALG